MSNSLESEPLNAQAAPSVDMTPSEVIHAVMRLWRILLYRKSLVLGALGVCLALGVAYYLTAPRYYRSTAKLLIVERKADELTSMGEQIANESLMATQRGLVVSPRVVQNALDTLPAEFQIDLSKTPRREWVEELSERLSAKAARKESFIEVSYLSLDPEAAAAVVSSVVNSSVDFVEDTHQGSAGKTIEELNSWRSRVEIDLTNKQQAMLELRGRVGHLAMGEEDGAIDPTVQRALRLNESWIAAQEKRIDFQARLGAVDAAIAAGHDLQQHLMALQETLGQQMLASSLGLSPDDLTAIREQEQELIGAKRRMETLSPYLGPANPKVLDLQAKIDGLEQYLANYRSHAGERLAGLSNAELGPQLRAMLSQAIQQAWHQERQMGAAFQSARSDAVRHSADLVDLHAHQRDVVRLENERESIIEQIAATDFFQSQGPIQAVIVRDPLPNDKPVTPRLNLVVVLSVLCGLSIGVVLAYVQDVLDDRFNSPEELSVQLGVPVLALVERLDPLPGEGLASLHTHMQPNAADSEAFRTLRTSLALNADVSDRILISSAEPGDGKTTVSANLAVALAQAGKRTLVIDADLRRPGMTALLGLKGVPGVVDILSSGQPPAELAPKHVLKTDAENLDVIPAGLRRPNPAELLSSGAFIELLAWADSEYEQVLVDCPPVLAVSDAQIVGRLVDGAILVVRPDKNHRRLVARACESFRATGTHVFGVVANDVSEFSGTGYGYGYGYSYGGEDEHEEPAVRETHPPKAA
ncbi:MAG: polysaccharide biosynthesis tyrosine autokinase [Aeoliella sp.]